VFGELDPVGHFLRLTPSFRGKRFLLALWERRVRDERGSRVAKLPDGSRIPVDLKIPYERTVWLQAEEWPDLCFLRGKLRPGDVFVDVGANIGLWSCVAASAVGPTGAVLSFEPNPATFAKLERNLEVSGRGTTVTPVAAAVSDDAGFASLRCPAQHNVSSIVDDASGDGIARVPTVRLEDEVRRRFRGRAPAGIKMDVEGHELQALAGAAGLLERDPPWLIVEFNTTLLASNRLRDFPAYVFLEERGFKPFLYDAYGNETPIDGSYSRNGYVNLLFQKT
jgi:FkbM family methyltransferase